MVRQSLSEGAATALSTSYTVIAVPQVPNKIQLGAIFGKIDTVASSAAAITYYLSADAAGDHAVSAESTVTIVTGKTTATDGGFAEAIDVPWSAPSWGTAGTLYVVAKTNTGTCNLTPGITWRGN